MEKAYFIFRKDLSMSPGKLSAQCGHGVDIIWLNRESNLGSFYSWQDPERGNRRKILLEIDTLEKLNNTVQRLRDDGMVVFDIFDAGYTEFEGETLTGVVVFPTKVENKKLKRLRLLS